MSGHAYGPFYIVYVTKATDSVVVAQALKAQALKSGLASGVGTLPDRFDLVLVVHQNGSAILSHMKVALPLNRALRLISPGGVSLVTTFYKNQFNITPVGWTTPMGNEPPLVGIALNPITHAHDLVKRSGEFVINIPTLDLLNQVVACGSVSGRDVDKFAQTGLRMVEAKVVRAPLIAECIGHLECAVVDAYSPGDHTLYVAEVTYAWIEEGTFDETWLVRERDLKPLHHLGGSRFGVIEGIVEPSRPDEAAQERRESR